MVFFNCNACGESLKKNQVEKHYMTKCRRCEVLSCVDCGKEFWGDSYATHTKCISEEQKYSGKNYVPKVNKGEAKQEHWIQKVQAAIQKAQANAGLRGLLQRMEEFPNIPRKKAKFENFLKCSMRVSNPSLISQVWDLLMAGSGQNDGGATSSDDVPKGVGKEVKGDLSEECSNSHTQEDAKSNGVLEAEKGLNKRERKEERRKKSHKREKKDKLNEEIMDSATKEGEQENGRKKSTRRKREEEEEQAEHDSECQSKGKRLKACEEDNVPDDRLQASADEQEASAPRNAAIAKRKFDWSATIVAVLKSKGEMSLKKLRKKVLGEYAAQAARNKSEEQILAKFNKKISRIPGVKVFKDRARLRES